MAETTQEIKPDETLDGIDTAFGPRSIAKLLPAYDSVPKEFRNGDTEWNKIFSRWFYSGLKKPFPFVAKEGVDFDAALRHVKTCMGSWEPKHEHKEAGCAYLMSLWFNLADGK